ncbi:hypothetical protein POPTR_012G108100v4 [Populus trichocarpa]|uniref:Uncharacterized protein n=2 Tax=Populus trichocarpa TaxID=3694 RepID=A0A2K1YBY4_POPTR|nr:uncharacterized protein LOC7484887 isoform X1 [Populus trichocarpa]KAI5569607.1 hypothetical protein BDE02_12G087900 [Populus trichocarpa]PNT10546.1 hypothetical protein POPTR_012G108100v4 [Populus trichocarpa]|eukprot:XP_024438560.1 uncharacterized protein LOC7484887 isoform X1 [Populus trichocarpa]
MSTPSPILKRPKLEQRNNDDDNEASLNQKSNENNGREEEEDSIEEQKVAFIALIEHRSHEVQHLKQRLSYYKTQLVEAEKRLEDSQTKLARLSGRSNASVANKPSVENGIKKVKMERKSPSPVRLNEASSSSQPQSRTELVIPAVNPKVPQTVKSVGSGARISCGSSAHLSSLAPSNGVVNVKVEKPYSAANVKVEKSNSAVKVKMEKCHRSSSDVEVVEIQDRGNKRKIEQKEHKELIPLVSRSSAPCTVHCHTSNHISSQHKRKLRSVAVCPVNDQLFVSSALDGMINLWQLQARGSGASLLSTTDSVSPVQRRWPEDIAWHPLGNSLFSAYTADSGDAQISVLNLNKTQGRARVTFLEDKPHIKGIINGIEFMPWENTCFVTGGSDHGVVLWNEKDEENSWKPKALHRNMHSSAVMGVAGMQQKQIVLSAGADKRIVGFDVQVGRADFKHQLDSRCMSVLPNPCDFNLFMVQTGTLGKQLRLFDIRLRQTEIHSFGFKQESSDSQSALINQAWSPDGLYLTSGSVDPVIHVFDIRYNYHKPSQSIKAHQKRVFKAVWHYSLPLLISISSDLHIGLHKII